MTTFGTPLRLLLGTLLLAPFATSGTVTQVSGPFAGASYTINSTHGLAISWTQSGGYTNVDIFAGLRASPDSEPGTAFLMTAIGPGTTTASEVASATFIAPKAEGEVMLFSGLTLGPGKYFLLLSSAIDDPAFIGWAEPSAQTYTHASDVVQTVGYDFYSGPGLNPYPPANTFNGFHFTDTEPLYRVTGDAVAAPEPASIGMAILALLCGLMKMKTRKGIGRE